MLRLYVEDTTLRLSNDASERLGLNAAVHIVSVGMYRNRPTVQLLHRHDKNTVMFKRTKRTFYKLYSCRSVATSRWLSELFKLEHGRTFVIELVPTDQPMNALLMDAGYYHNVLDEPIQPQPEEDEFKLPKEALAFTPEANYNFRKFMNSGYRYGL